MTGKRFSSHIDFFIDNEKTDDKLMSMEETVECLNALHEENEQLKQEIETLQEQIAHFDIGDME